VGGGIKILEMDVSWIVVVGPELLG
jgi:hypothetical protein